MKRILAMALSVLLVAGMAIGGSVAYLTSEDSAVNVMTVGNVEIEQHEKQRAEGVADNATASKAKKDLVDYDQYQPLYPAVRVADGAYTAAEAKSDCFHWGDYVTAEGAYNGLYYDNKLVGAIDKFVFVENTGESDCYFRTWVAFECPEGLTFGDVTRADIGFNGNSEGRNDGFYKWERLNNPDNTNGTYTIKVDGEGVDFVVYCATYVGNAETKGILASKETARPSLLQVAMNHECTNEDVEKLGDTYDILTFTEAVQADNMTEAYDLYVKNLNGAENAYGSAADFALETAFTKGTPKYHPWMNLEVERPSKVTADTWDGTADTSWYNETDNEFVITTAKQLAGLAKLVDGGNTFAGKTIKLGNDIDLYAEGDDGERISFNPIGYGYDIVFKGTFDGQEHTIENLYQNGWSLGYSYGTQGGGLFASVVDATIKNVNIDKAEVVMECVDMGVLVGYSYGDCTYENINVTNSKIANYQRYTGGVVGEVNGNQIFKNVDVKDTVLTGLWGDFDCSLGGIIGGKYGNATVTMEDCDVACVIDAFNDVTSTNQWYAYRRAGMLIGNSEETINVGNRTEASASYLTATNCTVTYGDWRNYTYCEFAGTSWPYVRVQASEHNSAYSNPRYGHPTDANGNEVVDGTHVHNEGEDHNILCEFDQLYGGGTGVYGGTTHDGVTVKYPNP